MVAIITVTNYFEKWRVFNPEEEVISSGSASPWNAGVYRATVHPIESEGRKNLNIYSYPVDSAISLDVENPIKVWIYPPELDTMNSEDDMTNEIVDLFKQVSEVAAIFHFVGPDYMEFNVFTTNQKYDAALMDKLFDREIIIMDKYPDYLFGFHYYRFDPTNKDHFDLSDAEKLIYQR